MSRALNRRNRALLAAAVLVACALVAAAIVVPCLGGPCQGGTLFSPAQGSGASGASGTAAPGGSGSGPDAGGSTGARREGYSADPATHEAATRLMDVDADYVADTVLIRFAPGVDADQATALVAATPTLAPRDVTPDELERGLSKVGLAAGATVEDAVVALSGNAGVSIVQPNYLYQVANETTLADDLGLDVAAEVSAAREAASAQSAASDPAQSAASAPAASAEAIPAEKSAAPEVATPSQAEQPAQAEVTPPAPAATDAAPAPAEPGAAPAAEAAGGAATEDAAPAEPSVDDAGAPFSEVPDPVEQADPVPADLEHSFGVASASPELATQAAVTVNDFATTQAGYTGEQRSWHLTFIKAFDAWAYLPKSGGQPHNSTSIAVLDNGFQRYNNDLSGKVAAAYNATDWSSDISEASNGHGTHVAGIAGAKVNNSWGTVGTSYDANLVLVKVMDSYGGITSDYLVEGYRYVMENASRYNIRTVNVSIGGRGDVPASDELLKDGVKAAFDKNIVSVMAACNAQAGVPVPYKAYPADYELCMSVINLQSDGTRKETSNYNLPGKTNKNISAPGTSIVSSKRDTIASDSGTSMASPAVAGVVSLLFAKRPQLTAREARAIIYATADRMGGADFTEGYGYGKVNALAAMQALEPQISGESSIVVGSSSKLALSCGATRFTTVSWSSSSNVASVASDGTVTGHGLGTATITATYTIRDNEGDSFTGTATKVVTIGKSFDGAKVSVPGQTFTGSALKPRPTVTYNGVTLREGTDYDYTVGPYYDNVNAGTGWVIITGVGEYAGKTAGSFSIAPASIAGASVFAAAQTYTGSALRPAVSVRAGGRTLSQGRDYDVSYANNTNPGTATVTVTGKGNYTGRATGAFRITDAGIVMYRLYNPYTGEHFYTASDYERASLARGGWNYEGVGWTAPSVGDSVFRLYNPYAGDHHYTTSWYECQSLQRVGWSYEGVGWKTGSGAPLLRQYNPYATTGTHNYTTSAYERDALIRLGWRDEGIGWRAL
ncbi:S8 family serine peptidase [Olsenella intestinalis]|uniref:S8 family serine peptidase n=1 Tax=Olsenella intestinalis TaxID=2930083 RepID=UPI00200E4008|nr:S8 family serine peptidase [Olsenella intestinalis]